MNLIIYDFVYYRLIYFNKINKNINIGNKNYCSCFLFETRHDSDLTIKVINLLLLSNNNKIF